MELRKALSVLLVAEAGLGTSQTSEILGMSERTVFRNRRSVRHQDERRRNTWGGRRHYSMTIEEERDFLRTWEAKANEGGVLSVPPIHAALVERLGRSIPLSTTYRLLARHGWRKVQPDTKHPKSKPEVQEEFKKNFPGWWRPPV
jgi:transposase